MARPRKQTYTMAQYLGNVNDGYISNDADTQRNPAWKPIVDGLAVTVLTDDYVPVIVLAEEDSGQIHIVDGGSRTAAFRMIRYGNYKIKSSVEDPIIQYKRMIKDENGKSIWEDAEFDIRNKTYEQFPKELQKKFDEYQVDTVVHEHCNKEKIAMYIKRYNEHKAMNTNQKMFVYIPEFAEKIRDISSNKFFIECCDIKDAEKEKGILERIISESVMCMFHFNKWNKNGKKLATYLNENGTKEQFEKLNNNIKRLENIITDDIGELFDKKDTFIYFSVFARFKKTGLDDGKFIEFLTEYAQSIHTKFDEIENKKEDGKNKKRSTKDKCVVVEKINCVESLMNEYLHVENNNSASYNESFVAEMVDMPVETVKEKMDCYEETLDGLENNTIRDGSKLLDIANRLSLLAMVAYSYKNDVDLDDWLEDYAANNNTYYMDQRKNYSHMVDDFKQYQKRVAIA